jgi:hypothetical protein
MRAYLTLTAITTLGLGALFAPSASAQLSVPSFHEDHDELHGVYYDGPSNAAYLPAVVTTNEAAIDAIFAVNAPPIDFRFLSTVTVFVDPAISSDVNTQAEWNTLVATAAGIGDPAAVISMWYVDALSTCGATENAPGIAGCAGGNVNVVESPVAAGGFGAELIAHELGHNLGLGHTPDALAPAGNLMDPTLNGNTTLTGAQQAAALADSKVQTDGGGRFVQIRPIIVAPIPVPEPSTAALISLSGLLLLGRRRR